MCSSMCESVFIPAEGFYRQGVGFEKKTRVDAFANANKDTSGDVPVLACMRGLVEDCNFRKQTFECTLRVSCQEQPRSSVNKLSQTGGVLVVLVRMSPCLLSAWSMDNNNQTNTCLTVRCYSLMPH